MLRVRAVPREQREKALDTSITEFGLVQVQSSEVVAVFDELEQCQSGVASQRIAFEPDVSDLVRENPSICLNQHCQSFIVPG